MKTLKIFNTLSRKVEEFEPIDKNLVRIYCCGPTVYHFAHLGNFRAYINEDILVRLLRYLGYSVKHVMNITDIGHLVSDADEGEDKMILAAKRERKSVLEVAEFYTNAFFRDSQKLNIKRPDVVCKATEHIQDMIELIKRLEDKGFTYISNGNVYFDTAKLPDYGKLRGGCTCNTISRVDEDLNKRRQEDFVLWFTKSKFENHILLWDSPWGSGYPGWHIECSAMAIKHLGESIDIHCGGVDHIPVHHTNEIAQSEGATGKPFAKYWVHNEFVLFNNDKMSKSKGTIVTVSDIEEQGFNALDYRYLCLTAHYRTQLNFTMEALSSARNARKTLIHNLAKFAFEKKLDLSKVEKIQSNTLLDPICEDLNTGVALAEIWGYARSLNEENFWSVLSIDEILGLNLLESIKICLEIPQDVNDLALERQRYRQIKDFKNADLIREKLYQMGYLILDSKDDKFVILRDTV